MLHVQGEASFDAEAPDQSRWCSGPRRRRTGSFAGGKRVRIRSCDCGRSAVSEHHTQSTLRSQRRGNSRRESCYIPPLRQGKRHRRLHAVSARLWRLRWMSWWWRWMSRLRRRRSRLWLQRLRLRRLRLRRLRLRRLLLIVGRLPLVLSRCNFSALAEERRCRWSAPYASAIAPYGLGVPRPRGVRQRRERVSDPSRAKPLGISRQAK